VLRAVLRGVQEAAMLMPASQTDTPRLRENKVTSTLTDQGAAREQRLPAPHARPDRRNTSLRLRFIR
jgi:hypothetical protein